MELFTLNRAFEKQDIIDEFSSVIWTERYYGDGDVELIVPLVSKSIEKLPLGIFLSLTGSKELMILETFEIVDRTIKFNGISLLPWLNNRFIRTSNVHKDRTWYIDNQPPGQILWVMLSQTVMASSPYLSGVVDIGIPTVYLQKLIIPEIGVHDFDTSGGNVNAVIPFGPLYDAMREFATTYQIGMRIIFETNPETEHRLGFQSYRGLNLTSEQSVNPIVRFSPFWDSLSNVTELQSIANLKHLIFTFAAEADDSLDGTGIAFLPESEPSGFDLRASEIFVDDIKIDIPDSEVLDILNERAKDELSNNTLVKAVDGDILPTHQFQYGRDYNLGDIVEIQGDSGYTSIARVTEYIHAQNSAGERTYPTVDIIRSLIASPLP